MAGYFIYSLDWNRFSSLVERPTSEQLAILAQLVADNLDGLDGEFEANDPVLAWPTDPGALAGLVAQRLALPDWYGDLTPEGKNLWESVLFSAALSGSDLGLDLGFRVESDGIYWDVIELAWQELGVPANTITAAAVSTFGTRPFRFHRPLGHRLGFDDWTPMHSMHPPDEVERLRQELRSLAPAIDAAHEDVQEQYTDELMPAIDQVADEGRLLFIQVDT